MDDDKRALRIHIQDLLDKCEGCEFKSVLSAPDLVHGHCPLYKEIRAAGDKLGQMQRAAYGKLEITVPEYWKWHNEGMTDEDIAGLKHVTQGTLGKWKNKVGVKTDRVYQPKEISTEDYNRLISEGKNLVAISKELGINAKQLYAWRKRHGIAVNKSRIRSTDEEVLKAIIDGQSGWWIQKHLGAGKARIFRIKKEHGITR